MAGSGEPRSWIGRIDCDGRESDEGGSVFLFIETSGYFPELPMSSFQLIVAAGGLLIVAAVLLGYQRRVKNVAVQRSLLTDELMIYLGRIADALERNAPPNKQMIISEIERRIAERGSKVQQMPYATVGKGEFPEKR